MNIIEKTTDKISFYPLMKIPGLDVQQGLKSLRGSTELYHQILNSFRESTEKTLPILQAALEANDLKNFVVHLFGIKGITATIGAEELSAQAAVLLNAGKKKNIALINKMMGGFVEQLKRLLKDIEDWDNFWRASSN